MTSAERHNKAIELFLEACDLPLADRESFLAQVCSDDAELQNEIESLLEHDSQTGDAVRAAEAGEGIRALSVIARGEVDAVPVRVGSFRIIKKIGHGGMGVVYEAQQERPRRTVALKLLHVGFTSDGVIKRFLREADLLGRLQHPAIAQVHEAGVETVEWKSGVVGKQPFLVMEMVHGQPLDQFAGSQNLDDRERVALFTTICDGVQHAHDRGVIHRDLKPGNILISSAGQPKILDFGVSRATDADINTVTLRTQVGQLVGTLPYMSPEQVQGDPGLIDERTDVYSLGVLLFELLAERLPLDVRTRSIPDAVRLIRDEEPTLLGSVDRRLRGDVETIVAKALEKDKCRRYESAAALGGDLRRYLNHEPVVARPATRIYQLRKFTRRNKTLVGGLIATFLVLVLGATGTTIGLVSSLRANKELTTTNDSLFETNRLVELTNENLRQVSEYQSAQLRNLDIAAMGLQMRADLLSAVNPETRGALDADISRINFVDLARSSLEHNFVQRAIESVDAQFSDQPQLQARLLQDLARTMRQLGLLNAAKDPQDRALAIRRRELGQDHSDTLASINESASLAQSLGDFEQAETLFREELHTKQRLQGEGAEDSLVCLVSLASVLRSRGEFEQAESDAHRAFEGLAAMAGDNHPATLEAGVVLAEILDTRGKYDESEQIYRNIVERRRATLGGDDPATLSAMADLGKLLENRGKYKESSSLAQAVLESRRRQLGEDHPSTISSMATFANLLVRDGKLDEAEPIARAALKKRRRLLGNDHVDTLGAIDLLASLLEEKGRFAESEALFLESLEGYRRTLGDKHPATLRATGNLGFILNKQRKYEQAEPLYRETLAGLREVYGSEHPHTLTSIGNLATLLSGIGKQEEAEPLYRESLEGRRKLLGDDHPSTLNAIYNMGEMLRRTGKLDEAEPYCRQALEGYRRVGGDDHIGTLYSLTNLGRLLLDQGKPAEAQGFFQEALDRRRRVNGDDHPQTILAAEGLADALEAEGNWEAAEAWRRLAYERSVAGDLKDPVQSAARQCSLGKNLLGQSKINEAERVFANCLAACNGLEGANSWRRWDAQSLLGTAIASDPGRYSEAEQLLLEAARGISDAQAADREIQQRIAVVRRRVYDFYHKAGNLDASEEWRDESPTNQGSNQNK